MDIYVIDRFENDFAVCEKNGKKMVNIPISSLPENVKEGVILRFKKGVYTVDETAQIARQEKIRKLQDELFK